MVLFILFFQGRKKDKSFACCGPISRSEKRDVGFHRNLVVRFLHKNGKSLVVANCEEERQRQLGWVGLDWIRMEKETEKKKRVIEIEKVCKRCKQIYSPCSNTPSSCRFHPSFFVCRRHDDQKRCLLSLSLSILLLLLF